MEDSAAKKLLTTLRRRGPPPPSADFVTGRRDFDELSARNPLPKGVRYLPERHGGIPCERALPEDPVRDELIVYFHGGGFVMGSVATHRALTGNLCLALRRPVLSVDYRLAPEFPYPAAREDGLQVWHSLVAKGSSAGRLVVAGDSAGGAVGLSVMQALQMTGAPGPAAAFFLSPWLDLTLSGASMESNGKEDPMVSRAGLEMMGRAYRAGVPADDTGVSPLFGPMTGLPPTLVHCGSTEVLLDDAVRFVRAMEAGGSRAQLDIAEGMVHVWHAFAPRLPEAVRAIGRIAAWLDEIRDSGER